jgi:hypothetical protein
MEGDLSEELRIALGLGAALIAALASLAVAVISRKTALRNQDEAARQASQLAELQAILRERQSKLEAELAERRTQLDARTEYDYKARIRLYEEYEPLLFQLVETCEAALYRIFSFARSARLGDIRRDGSGWLEGVGYYLTTTVYTLLCPLVVFSIIRRRLTLVDLTVDPYIAREYALAKRLYYMFTDDFEFAREEPTVAYDPFAEPWLELRRADPARHWRQGAAIGRIDNAVEALMVGDEEISLRRMTLGQFEKATSDEDSDVSRSVVELFDLFVGFHPATRPVLWRILVTKAHLYQSFLSARDAKLSRTTNVPEPWTVFPPESRQPLDWRREPSEAADEDVLVHPFEIAQRYLQRNVGAIVVASGSDENPDASSPSGVARRS